MPPRRTSSSTSNAARLLPPVAVLLLIAGGIGGTLWASGFFEQKSTPISREGQVAFPALARPVRAYDAITRDDLINPQTRQLNVTWIPEAQASSALLRNLSQIIGRVVTRDKQAGYVLTERDLFPKGTRPGIAAGIPPGKRSVTVTIDAVPGLELLHQGDLFDLLVVLPERDEPESNVEQAALLGGIKPPDTRSGQLARQTGTKPLVIGGMMVAITHGKNRSTDGAQGLVVPPAGSRTARTPQMIATIAVDPVEVAPLTEALGLDLNLYCVARSGHPEDTPVVSESVSLEGLVPVITLARPVAAFAGITQDDLADQVTGRLNLYYFPPEDVEEGWLTGFGDLNSRVPARDLSRGAVITEADLMPAGTRPGVVGAIPSGMEALFVDAERITGLSRLHVGDRFEIHSHLPDGFAPSATKPTTATVFGGRLSVADQALQDELRTGIRILSRSALILQISGSAGDGKVSIAVDRDEVRSLLQALQLDHELFAIGRSEDVAPVDSQGPLAGSRAKRSRELMVWEGDEIPVSFVAQRSPAKGLGNDADTVAVPILIEDVLPRTRMSVDEFIEPSTGKVRYLQFAPGDVPEDVMTDLREIIGRRSGRQLYAGEWVVKGDLCDVRQWSVPCDIPADWSVIELNSLDVRGIQIAEVGDFVDLVAVRPIASLDLQTKAEWPFNHSDAAFHRSTREDIFTQGDVTALVTQARVVGRAERTIQVPTVEEKETVGGEKQLGEAVERESVQKTSRVSFVSVEAVVFQVAVPLKSVVSITEALAIKSIVRDGEAGARNSGPSDAAETPEAFLDQEVAIYAVLRSPSASQGDVIPQRDIVADWMSRWGERFSRFSKSERRQAKAVRTVQHIRGNAISEDHWLDGRPYDEFPSDAVQSRTVETLIDRKQRQGER